MNKISKYTEYIKESRLEMLLESKLIFMPMFQEVISNIDSRIAKHLRYLMNKDVDVNTNYIDINIDKNDSILFKPDDKVSKLKAKVIDYHSHITRFAEDAIKNNTYPITRSDKASVGQEVEIIKILTMDDIVEVRPELAGTNIGVQVAHVRWEVDGEMRENFYQYEKLSIDINKVKSNEFKIGRFVRALLSKEDLDYTEKEIEDFVSKYKAVMEITKGGFNRFDIVNGEDIRKWYHRDNYETQEGTLGSSCMRYKDCQDYFDIYTNNPDKVSMIILMGKEDDSKISGRALLWTNNKGEKFMDRVYTNNSSDEKLFIEYAIKNDYFYKEYQSSGETNFMFNRVVTYFDPTTTLKKGEYKYYPYLDTLMYYRPDTGIITDYDYRDSYITYKLTSTSGGNGICETCQGRNSVECVYCEGDATQECTRCDGNGETDCSTCDGTGVDDSEDCEDCGGTGVNSCDRCDSSGRVDCWNCDGQGYFDCDEC